MMRPSMRRANSSGAAAIKASLGVPETRPQRKSESTRPTTVKEGAATGAEADEDSDDEHEDGGGDSIRVPSGRNSKVESERNQMPAIVTDSYALDKPLGSGAFGTVWKATHKESGEPVAIKVIERQKQVVEDFRLELNEAEILKALDHPNIVLLRELSTDPSGTASYLIMEVVEGGNLQDRLDEQGAFNDADAAEIFRQVASAIGYLHERNITHRDIKPENILFVDKESLRVKLTDFGMSTMKDGRLTTRCGTPSYVAPELLGGDGYGKAVDMWSLGVLAYALVYGALPFVAPSRDELFAKIRKGAYELPSDDSVSDKAKDLIVRLLRSNPMQRYTTRETLQHPWVTGGEDLETSYNSLDTVHEMMRRFNAERRWRRFTLVVGTVVTLQRLAAKRKGVPWPPPMPEPAARTGALAVPTSGREREVSPKPGRDSESATPTSSLSVPAPSPGTKSADPSPKGARVGTTSTITPKMKRLPPGAGSSTTPTVGSRATGPRVPIARDR